jgi:hypothetical protein
MPLSREFRGFVDAVSALVPITFSSEIFSDPGLEETLRVYNDLPTSDREEFIRISMQILRYMHRKKEQCESLSVAGLDPENPPSPTSSPPDWE